jgi:glutathione S-transferase
MTEVQIRELVQAAAQAVKDPARTRVMYAGDRSKVRFELFHSKMSLCSQKVCALLAHKRIPYISHELTIICYRDSSGHLTPAENYFAAYVTLRLLGRDSPNLKLAESWTGSTSVATEGFDACVVPTLVDLQAERVIVDSARIIEYLDQVETTSPRLIPSDAESAQKVRRQVEIVDRTPHGSLLAGFHPDDDRRPEVLRQIMLNYHLDKIPVLERLLADNSADAQLTAAYKAKITKENVGEIVCHDDNAQREARRVVQRILRHLEEDLTSAQSSWLCGPRVTAADLVWGVSLFRMKYLGLEYLWSALPRVSGYFGKLCDLAAIRSEAIQATVSSFPPSLYITETV